MRLWNLGPIEDHWHDCVVGFVVRAETEAEARRLAQEQHGMEGELVPVWTDASITRCEPLEHEGEARVLITHSTY